MSTTVTYKGETLTTVDNATVTLETAGKYCEDDFTLTDVSGGGGGGTATLTINPAPTSMWDITAQTDVTYNNGIELPYGELIEWGEMMGGTRASVSPADNPYTVYSWIVWVESGPITTYRMVVPSFDCSITIN